MGSMHNHGMLFGSNLSLSNYVRTLKDNIIQICAEYCKDLRAHLIQLHQFDRDSFPT